MSQLKSQALIFTAYKGAWRLYKLESSIEFNRISSDIHDCKNNDFSKSTRRVNGSRCLIFIAFIALLMISSATVGMAASDTSGLVLPSNTNEISGLTQSDVMQSYASGTQNTVSFAQSVWSRSKAAGTINIPVSLLFVNGTSTVQYQIVSGTAIAGTDFTASGYSGTLTFGPSNLTRNITVTLVNDGSIWPVRKQFYVKLSNPSSNLKLGTYTNLTVSLGNKGGIALTFDDGLIDNWYPYNSLFQTYHARATLNMLRIDDFSSVQLSEMDTMHNEGNEIASHSMNHYDAVDYTSDHTVQQWLDTDIIPSINELSARYDNVYTFAYPYSSSNSVTDAALKPYFRTIRSATWPDTPSSNSIASSDAYYNWDNCQLVYGIEIDDHTDYSVANIENGMDEAANDGTVLILYGHEIVPTVPSGSSGDYHTSVAKLTAILSYAYANNITFYRMGDLNSGIQTPWTGSSANATYVSDSIPKTMIAGETYNVTINFTDSGTTTWSSATGDKLVMWGQTGNLALNNDTSVSGYPAFSIPAGITVQPGQTFTWNITMVPQWAVSTSITFQVEENSSKYLGTNVSDTMSVAATAPSALYISDSIPTNMIAGETYHATVNFTNNGNTPWSSARGVTLAMWGQTWNYNLNNDTTVDSMPAWNIPAGVTIQPGQTYTWNLTLQPQWSGTFGVGFQMVQQTVWKRSSEMWLGNYASKNMNVAATAPSALYISDNIPSSMMAGETYHATVNFTNNGNTPWNSGRGVTLAMWGQTWNFGMDNDSSLYGMPAWSIPSGVTILPGQTYSWNLTFVPQWPASTNIGFQVVQLNNWMSGSEKWLGNYGGRTISVDPASPGASYVSDSIPDTMNAGSTYLVAINFTNTGNMPWNSSRGDILVLWGQTWNLGMDNDTSLYGQPAWSMPAGMTIQPGQTYTWYLLLRPQWATSTSIGFQMVQKNNWMSGSEKWLGNYASKTMNVT